jgi:hypothetical protein
LEESGQLVKSLSETEMLDNYARIYVRFKNPGEARIGDRFFIYHTGREVTHPVTHNRVGYITAIVGTMKVTAVDPNQTYVTGVIDGAFDEIKRGDYLAPYTDKLSRLVTPKTNGVDVKGYILDNLGDQKTFYGQNMTVFVDKGRKDGVEDGNIFTVIRQVDGTVGISGHPGEDSFYDKSLPGEVVGKLMVVDAKDTVSTCIALANSKELFPGDRVETFLNDTVPTTISQR